MATDRRATDMEYLVRIRSVLKYRGIDPAALEGAIICSVVPIVTMNIRPAVEQLIGKKSVVVGPGLKTGLRINIDNPGALGAEEDGVPRMVTTPWYDQEIPMTQAAELGTKKGMDGSQVTGASSSFFSS